VMTDNIIEFKSNQPTLADVLKLMEKDNQQRKQFQNEVIAYLVMISDRDGDELYAFWLELTANLIGVYGRNPETLVDTIRARGDDIRNQLGYGDDDDER